jgi:hypothetical protein
MPAQQLTPEMVAAIDRCSVQTLVTLRQQYPVEADWLFTTMVARSFLDMLRDNQHQLDVLIEMFNASVEVPVRLHRTQ